MYKLTMCPEQRSNIFRMLAFHLYHPTIQLNIYTKIIFIPPHRHSNNPKDMQAMLSSTINKKWTAFNAVPTKITSHLKSFLTFEYGNYLDVVARTFA